MFDLNSYSALGYDPTARYLLLGLGSFILLLKALPDPRPEGSSGPVFAHVRRRRFCGFEPPGEVSGGGFEPPAPGSLQERPGRPALYESRALPG